MSQPLITVDNLKTYFYTDGGVVKAVDDVSIVIPKGKTLGLVGESGCGKSVTAMSIIRLISPPGQIAGGRITMHARRANLRPAIRQSTVHPPTVRPEKVARSCCRNCPKARCARSAAHAFR